MLANINNQYKPIPGIKRQVSFGKITPQHVFIDMGRYPKDKTWAKKVCELIDGLNITLEKNPTFNTFIKRAQEGYNRTYKDLSSMGKLRYDTGGFSFNSIKYKDTYFLRAQKYWNNLTTKSAGRTNGKPILAKANGKNKVIGTLQKFKIKPTNETEYIVIKNTEPEEIANFWDETEKIFNNIEKTRKEIKAGKRTKENLASLNEKIGKFHWYFTNIRPYERGSAGIADVVAKSIYESAGVQISPFKKNVAPDLEAMVTPLDEYMKNYSNLYKKPPKYMDK